MSTFNYQELFIPLEKRPGETEGQTRENRDFHQFLQDMQVYSGITSHLKKSYDDFKRTEKEKEGLGSKARRFESSFANRPITDSDQLASENEIQNRRNRGQGPIMFRDYQTGSLLFGDPSQNEMQWQVGRSRDTRSGILSAEKTTWGQIAQRQLATDFVDESFFKKHEGTGIFSSPERRAEIIPKLQGMAKYGETGAGASWLQYAPGYDPEDRYSLAEEVVSATILPGYKAIFEFGRNYFGTDPVDLTEGNNRPIGWDPKKAWDLYSKDYPDASAWLLNNGMNPQEYLFETVDDFHFFERIGDFIDNNAFQRTTANDIQLMGDAEYTWKTTVLPLIRDSFASADAPIDIATTALLSSVSFGTAGVGYLAARGSLVMGKYGISAHRAAQLVETAVAIKRISDKTISWLPHNIPGQLLWTPGKSLASRVGHYTASAVGVGVVTGAWYNIVNQIQNSNSDPNFRFSATNLYHDVLMEIVGEVGLGALGTAGTKTIGVVTNGINELSENGVAKLSKKFLGTLPAGLRDTLLASAAVLHPEKNLSDMSKYELQRHTDAVMLWYQLKKSGLLGDGKQNNTLTIGAWGIASGLLGPANTRTVVDKANKDFDAKKAEHNLTEDDRDLFVSQMLVNSIAAKGIDIEAFSDVFNRILMEKLLGVRLAELQQKNKDKESGRLQKIDELETQLLTLEEEHAKSDVVGQADVDERIENTKKEVDSLREQSFSDNVGELFEDDKALNDAFQKFKEERNARAKELMNFLVGDRVVNSNLQLVNKEDTSNVEIEDLNEINSTVEESGIADSGLPINTGQQISNQLADAAIEKAKSNAPQSTSESKVEGVSEEEKNRIDLTQPDITKQMETSSPVSEHVDSTPTQDQQEIPSVAEQSAGNISEIGAQAVTAFVEDSAQAPEGITESKVEEAAKPQNATEIINEHITTVDEAKALQDALAEFPDPCN